MKRVMLVLVLTLLALSCLLTSCDGGNGQSSGAGGEPCVHSVSNESIQKEATCTEEGILGGICDKCSQYVMSTYPSEGHNFVDGVCTACGESE